MPDVIPVEIQEIGSPLTGFECRQVLGAQKIVSGFANTRGKYEGKIGSVCTRQPQLPEIENRIARQNRKEGIKQVVSLFG